MASFISSIIVARIPGTVLLKAGFELDSAYLCNLLEETEQALDITDNAVQLQVTPYQISTLRLVPLP